MTGALINLIKGGLRVIGYCFVHVSDETVLPGGILYFAIKRWPGILMVGGDV